MVNIFWGGLIMRTQLVLLAVLTIGCTSKSIDIGMTDQKELPAANDLRVPKNDEGVVEVGVRAKVAGQLSKDDKRTVYLLVSPLSNSATRNRWWVQEEVVRDGDNYEGTCQFGENAQGAGEYFAIVAMATSKKFNVGEKLTGVPMNQTYTKLKIVKRSR
jgi:hypothetical protein